MLRHKLYDLLIFCPIWATSSSTGPDSQESGNVQSIFFFKYFLEFIKIYYFYCFAGPVSSPSICHKKYKGALASCSWINDPWLLLLLLLFLLPFPLSPNKKIKDLSDPQMHWFHDFHCFGLSNVSWISWIS